MRIRAAITVISACGVAPLLVAAPANAQENAYAALAAFDGPGRAASIAAFAGYDEVFEVQDSSRDGHSAVIKWRVGSRKKVHKRWDHSGSDGDSKVFDAEISEGKRVRIKACAGEYETRKILRCSAWSTGEA